jgi:hypothetical protein
VIHRRCLVFHRSIAVDPADLELVSLGQIGVGQPRDIALGSHTVFASALA